MFTIAKRVVVGRPLDSDAAGHATLPKRLALPIFCSDPLSSVAYATQEILLVLAIGGAAALTLTPWVGLAVVFLLVVVVASYSKTVHAYPGGGGAYAVSKENLGQTPGTGRGVGADRGLHPDGVGVGDLGGVEPGVGVP